MSNADLRPYLPPLSGKHLRAQGGYYWDMAASEMTAEARVSLLRLAECYENLARSMDAAGSTIVGR
jgi:hypothetical protein